MASMMQKMLGCCGCCTSRRWRRQVGLHNNASGGKWGNVRLYSDEEEGETEDELGVGPGRDTDILLPLYSFAQPQPQTSVKLDLASAGQYAVIVKNNTRLCGSGAARANVPILQDKAYFEVKVQSNGLWAVGLCHSKADLNTTEGIRSQEGTWALFNDGVVYHASQPLAEFESRLEGSSQILDEGDTLGVFYDHTELRFSVNGVPQGLRDHEMRCSGVTGVRGTVYSLLAVDGGAILDVRFTSFQFPPREGGFSEIRMEHDIL